MGRACARLVIDEDFYLRKYKKKAREKDDEIVYNDVETLSDCIIYMKKKKREEKSLFDIELNHDLDVWIRWTLELYKVHILHHIIRRNIYN
jgi:hypothetical protein